jgi:hypothetical protein
MRVSQRRRDAQQLISLIAGCDPLGDRSTGGWSRTDEADAMLGRIVAGELSAAADTIAATPPRRRGKRPAILAVAVLIAGASVAAASQLLGGPAPSQVKEDLANVDQGIPADLRYNPDVEDARLVAQADGASLYSAGLADGGYCSEIVTPASGPAGAICVPGGSLDQEPAIHVTVPFDDPITTSSPFVVGGRVNVSGVTSLQATFSDGSTQAITLGDHGFFVFAVATDQLAEAHQQGVRLVASDAAGTEIASVDVPPTDFSDPAKQDARQPIFVSTISTGNDLTKVLGVEGSVNVSRAVTLELRYPDGTTVDIPIAAAGGYRYDLPGRRTGDLFDTPGWLIARDAVGNELARAPVAAVAYWRTDP